MPKALLKSLIAVAAVRTIPTHRALCSRHNAPRTAHHAQCSRHNAPRTTHLACASHTPHPTPHTTSFFHYSSPCRLKDVPILVPSLTRLFTRALPLPLQQKDDPLRMLCLEQLRQLLLSNPRLTAHRFEIESNTHPTAHPNTRLYIHMHSGAASPLYDPPPPPRTVVGSRFCSTPFVTPPLRSWLNRSC